VFPLSFNERAVLSVYDGPSLPLGPDADATESGMHRLRGEITRQGCHI